MRGVEKERDKMMKRRGRGKREEREAHDIQF